MYSYLQIPSQKVFHFLSIATIEPMMLLEGIANHMAMYSQEQMLIYKTCRGEINFSSIIFINAFCSQISIQLKSFVKILRITQMKTFIKK